MADLADSGGVRRLQARWVLTADLVLLTAAHLGGQDQGAADLNVIRDRVGGGPLLPGTSLAGALRGHLCDRLGGYASAEADPIGTLFGARRADDGGSQSPLVVFDSLGRLPTAGTEIRDGVSIDHDTGTAAKGKKFDLEVLPAGTQFPARLELLIDDGVDEHELVSLLLAALQGLADREIALGARRSRGLGRLEARAWRAHRYDLSSADGWLAWLCADPAAPIPADVTRHEDPAPACDTAWPTLRRRSTPDQRERVTVVARLEVQGGLLVRSPADSADAPDVAHLRSGGVSVLPGTSLAGVLRARALRILDLLGADGRRDDLIDGLFGWAPQGRAEAGGWSSRLRIAESVIDGGDPVRQTRIRVDRATQGVARGALFEEEPQIGGQVVVQLELRSPQRGETGLLLLLLKDLLDGDLPVGGSAAVGRGVVRGSAVVTFPDGSTARLEPPEAEQRARLDAEIRMLAAVAARQEAAR
ncbi:MAG: RAMP superfamily CRISPR-associated protein [Egibacteraceae bacterium]